MSKAEVVKEQVFPNGYTVIGERYCILDKSLEPGEVVQAERGTMMYMTPNVEMSTKFNGTAILSGEPIAKVHFTNKGTATERVGLATNMPMAVVVPIEMDRHAGILNCKRGAYMASDTTVRVMPKMLPSRSCTACLCGGMPPVIQELRGTGFAVINAGGTIVKQVLAPGQELIVSSDSIVAFTDTVGFDVRQVGSLLTCCCGGEGFFNTVLTGPGTVYLQTLSYERLARQLVVVHEANSSGASAGALAAAASQ
ncbi:hypothetical protein KFE25_004950 [Diacronema lutheri]|uniref:Altered inheritance of mitochondria protein 24, mitochondrial n=1 Tax=Diacronema lutheri TaxID=2081491 RepID=A0A8J5XF56_DIALT|nr:hypothetical protein KFE25_004950 [Diacronema lutheri]